MKFSALTYAKAFAEAVAERPKNEVEIRKRFLSVVVKHGDAASLPKIIHELTQLTDRAEKVHRVNVESARPMEEGALRELRDAFGSSYVLETSVVPALVAGVRITIDGEHVIDASLAGRAKKLFL